MLNHFREAAAEFAIGKGAQQFRICKHQLRRIEGSDQIFSLRKIDASFAAYRTVDLGDEGCGDMDKFHTAQVSSRRKAGHITDHSTANRDKERLAIGAGAAKGARNVFHTAEILVGFGVIEEMNGPAFRNV